MSTCSFHFVAFFGLGTIPLDVALALQLLVTHNVGVLVVCWHNLPGQQTLTTLVLAVMALAVRSPSRCTL